MKYPLLIATVAGVGCLAALGGAAVHGDLWQSPEVSVQQPPAQPRSQSSAVRPVTPAADAATPPQPAAAEPATSDPEPDDREAAASGPAATYEKEAAARDRAAAHSVRSR